jgi:hypothetical protein
MPAVGPALAQRRHLFIDDVEVDACSGLSRTVHAAVKHSGNPVLVPEPPWEGAMVPSTVIFDDADDTFKLWYLTHARVPGVESTYVTCFATSSDGIHWDRPSVGDYEYDGSRNNNICLGNTAGGMGVIKDARDPDPSRRFKALVWHGGNRSRADVERGWGANEQRGFYTFVSPDGLHWSSASEEPVLTGTGDTESLFGWDERCSRYVAYVRPGRKRIPGDPVPHRVIGRSTSEDFVHWTDPVVVIAPDADDPPASEHYFMPVQVFHGQYVGVVHVFVPSPDPFGPFWPELTASRDGVRWRRLNDSGRQRLVHPGPAGSFDAGMIRCARGIVERGDELWLYYGGWREDHGASRQHRHMTTPREAQRQAAAIGLARLRLDGFVSLDAGDEDATLTTVPLPCAGQGLTLNARVTRPGGYVVAEVLDEAGQPLAGYTRDDAIQFDGDDVRHACAWRERGDLERLRGEQVRVRLTLRNAQLFSLSV